MRLDTEGIEGLAEWLLKQADIKDGLTQMLDAGAKEVQKCWREEAEARGHRDTGAMIASIGYKGVNVTNTGGYVEVYPRGTDKGTRNAEKAFILNYGSSRIKGDGWVHAAEGKAEDRALEAMQEVFNSIGGN